MKKKLLSLIAMTFTEFAIAQTGSLDSNFDPGSGASDIVYSNSIQSDEKIIIAGNFTLYNGIYRQYITRVNTDGSLDNSFLDSYNGANGTILSTAIQSDGKIIIGGYFPTYHSIPRNHIARINQDGTLDNGFDPGTGFDNDNINTICIQSNGEIIIAGDFTSYNGITSNNIVRVNTDGSIDSTFHIGTGTNNDISCSLIQSDGKIVIGGVFTSFDGTQRNTIARINSDGTLDTSFNPGTGTDYIIKAMAIQSDGKIVVGGSFTFYNGITRHSIARINIDGSLDTSFDPGTGPDNGSISSMSIQNDGKIIIGGFFTSYNGRTRYRIARINADGSLDLGFDPGTGASDGLFTTVINTISIQSDGKIIIGGNFTLYNGTERNFIARVNGDSCNAAFSLLPDTSILHHYWALNLAYGIPPLTYYWSWGDGTYDSIQYPSHTYSTAGLYTICLTINDSTGCTSNYCNSYDVQKMSEENTIVKVDVVDSIPSIPTTIENTNVLQSWSVFPNPASGNSFINYTLSTPATVSIALYDVLGNKLQQLVNGNQEQGEHNATIDARKLANGVYVLQIRAAEQVVRRTPDSFGAEQKVVLLR